MRSVQWFGSPPWLPAFHAAGRSPRSPCDAWSVGVIQARVIMYVYESEDLLDGKLQMKVVDGRLQMLHLVHRLAEVQVLCIHSHHGQ